MFTFEEVLTKNDKTFILRRGEDFSIETFDRNERVCKELWRSKQIKFMEKEERVKELLKTCNKFGL